MVIRQGPRLAGLIMAVSSDSYRERVFDECVLINFSGPTGLEHPAACCPHLIRSRFTACLYQHWIHNRLEIYQLSGRRCDPQFVPGDDWLFDLATAIWSGVATAAMVSWQGRASHQHCRIHVRAPALVLHLLATRYASLGQHDELV